MNTWERFAVSVLIQMVALFFSTSVGSSTTTLELSQPISDNLQVGYRRVSAEEEVRLPALGTGEHSRKTKIESPPPAKDTWGQQLLTEFAGVLIAAGDGLNSDHGPTMLSAVIHQTRRRVRRRVAHKVAASTQGWLRQYGQASVSFDGDEEKNFSWHVDYSQPIYQSRKNIWLLEVGGYSGSGHYLVSSGLVYRRGWRHGQILGMNLSLDHCLAAFDRSMTLAHHRGSVGVEWKTPQWGVDANAYMPMSIWKPIGRSASTNAPTHANTLWSHGRPAGGADVTFQYNFAYAPLRAKAGYFGVKASYSRWFADSVGVAQQGGPSSTLGHGSTLGVVWQPIALLKLSINHTFAPEGPQNNWLRAELHMNLAKSFRQQLRSTGRESARTRWQTVQHQFVNRNREMILAFSGRILEAGPDVTKEICSDSGSECAFIQAATGGNGRSITYSSSNPEIAKVETATGRVTLVGVGTTRITATEAGTDKHQAQSDSYMLTVTAKLQLDCDNKGSCPDPYKVTYDKSLITKVRILGEEQGTIRCDVGNSDVATCSESDGVWQIQPRKAADTAITFRKTWDDGDGKSKTAMAGFTYQVDKGSGSITLECDGHDCGSVQPVEYAENLTTTVQVLGGNQGAIDCNVEPSEVATCSGSNRTWQVQPKQVGETAITFTETTDNFAPAQASFTYLVTTGGGPITLKCNDKKCGFAYEVQYANGLTTNVQVLGGNQGTIDCAVDKGSTVATCEGGGHNWTVTPKQVGATNITCTETKQNFAPVTAGFNYQVTKGRPTPLSIGQDKTDYIGHTYQHKPTGGNKEKISWSSGSETVATIDDQGEVTVLAEGEATITGTQAETELWLGEEDSYTLSAKYPEFHVNFEWKTEEPP